MTLADAAVQTDLAGLAAALGAAVLWAVSTMLYSRTDVRVSPVMLNFVKGAVACAGFVLTLIALRKPIVAPLWESDATAVAFLGISGIVGIGIGDSFYFACMRNLGPRLATLLYLLAVPAAAFGGLILLGERLPLLGVAGIGLTLGGIAWVVSERRPAAGDLAPHPGRILFIGVTFGVLAALCQAGGALMNRSVLRADEFDVLWSATWRLAAGTAVLLVWLPWEGRGGLRGMMGIWGGRRSAGSDETVGVEPGSGRALLAGSGSESGLSSGAAPRFWRYLLPATLLGTYGGIWLQQVAFARADTGYVQTLLSTTPIWILPMAMLAGERVSARAVLGSLLALGGVAMLILSTRM